MEASRSKSPKLTTLMGSNQADVVKLAGPARLASAPSPGLPAVPSGAHVRSTHAF